MSAPKSTLTREELHALLWARPIVKLAAELGCSYPELVAICTTYNIPRPSGGYARNDRPEACDTQKS